MIKQDYKTELQYVDMKFYLVSDLGYSTYHKYSELHTHIPFLLHNVRTLRSFQITTVSSNNFNI